MSTTQPPATSVVIDTSLVAVIAWVVIAVIVIGFVWRMWPMISKAVRAIDALGGLASHVEVTNAAIADLTTSVNGATAKIENLEGKVDSIHHETHNNDGSSIKDAVDRIEKAQREDRKVRDGQIQALMAADDRVSTALESHLEWSRKYVERQA